MIFSVFLKMLISWAVKNWKIVAIVGAVVAVYIYHRIEVNRSWHAGREDLKTEQIEEAKRRDSNAQEADRIARDCARDPACLVQDDGHRRD